MATRKPVVVSGRAQQDIQEAVDFYARDAGADVALRFVDAVESALALVARQPGIGSPRLGHELQIPGLRSWPLTGFPQLLLYLDHDDAIDVVRVLHGARDIPATLQDTTPL